MRDCTLDDVERIIEMAHRKVDRSHMRRKVLREQTAERTEIWRKLTPQQQLDALDARLGKGVGAVKQRARLIKMILK